MSQTTNSIPLDDAQFTIQALENLLNETGVDRWLTIEVAALYAGVNPLTVKKLVDRGFYIVDDKRIEVPVKKEPGMKPKISARALIDYMKYGYNRKGFRGSRNTPTKSYIVRMPREIIPEILSYLRDRSCEIVDPADMQRRYLKQRREKLAALRQKQNSVNDNSNTDDNNNNSLN